MKSRASYLSVVAMLCISTVAFCEIQHQTWWDGAGGSGYYASSDASAVASGSTYYEETCASGSHDIITTEANYFDVFYYIDAGAFASYTTNDNYGGQSQSHGEGYASVTGGPWDKDISASASITGALNPASDYSSDEPSSDSDSTTYSFDAYTGISAMHTVWAWAEIWEGSDNEATASGSAEACIDMW